MPLPQVAEWLGHSKMDTARQFYATANEISNIPTFYNEIIENAALNKHFQDKWKGSIAVNKYEDPVVSY